MKDDWLMYVKTKYTFIFTATGNSKFDRLEIFETYIKDATLCPSPGSRTCTCFFGTFATHRRKNE